MLAVYVYISLLVFFKFRYLVFMSPLTYIPTSLPSPAPPQLLSNSTLSTKDIKSSDSPFIIRMTESGHRGLGRFADLKSDGICLGRVISRDNLRHVGIPRAQGKGVGVIDTGR